MDINELRNCAEQHYSSRRLPEALDAYARLCKQTPDDAQAWHMQAAISGMLGQYQQTADCCQRAIALAPGAASLYTNYASALIELSRHDDALGALEKALELKPADINILIMLGRLHLFMKNKTKAAAAFQRAFGSAPDNAEAASNLARLLLDSGKIAESASICERALFCNPGHSHLLLTLIECHVSSGESDKCREALGTAIPHIDKLAGYLYAITCKLHAKKQYTLAIPAIKLFIETFPEKHKLNLLLADCQIKTGNNSAAITTLESYRGTAHDYDTLMLLAEAFNNSNDFDKAMACALEASGIAPGEAASVTLLSRIYQGKSEPDKALQLLETFLENYRQYKE